GMAGGENEAKEIVADIVVDRGVEIRTGVLAGLEVAPELLVLSLEQLVPAQAVDPAVLRGRHEPGARVVRNARLGPSLERGDEGVLRQVLGETDVANHPREAGDELGRLDPKDRVDRAMGVGSRHGYRSHHLHSRGARPTLRKGPRLSPALSGLRLHLGKPGRRLLDVGGKIRHLLHLANLDRLVLGTG